MLYIYKNLKKNINYLYYYPNCKENIGNMLKIGKEFPFLNLGYVPIVSIGLKVNLAKMLLKEVQNLLKVGMRVT